MGYLNQNIALVIRQNDNTSPGAVTGGNSGSSCSSQIRCRGWFLIDVPVPLDIDMIKLNELHTNSEPVRMQPGSKVSECMTP